MGGVAVVPTASFTTTADDREFMVRAACRTEDPAMFYPPIGKAKAAIAEAKRVCARCPVRRECRKLAFDTDEQFGVWGGLTASERRAQVRRAARRAARTAAGEPSGQDAEQVRPAAAA